VVARGDVPMLVLEGVTKRFGDIVAVDDVTIGVGPGEVLGLVGASGSGKSTIARLVTGLTAPDAGRVLLDGVALEPDVRRRPDAARLSLQMVFQSPDATLNPRHRVGAILARAITKLGGSRTAAELAEEVRLDPALLARRAANLSGGQKQRVAIARALAGDPALVVCDEPVSALDVSVQAGILTLLAELQRRRGTALLFISHDLAVVEYIADRVAVMHEGRIVDEGDPAIVLRSPTHAYTRELVAARSTLAEVHQRLADGSVEAGDSGLQLAVLPGDRRATRAP
jgi:peptide/nickel transport system ATP-binding protein